jgi:hypothetical protein
MKGIRTLDLACVCTLKRRDVQVPAHNQLHLNRATAMLQNLLACLVLNKYSIVRNLYIYFIVKDIITL